MRLFESPKLRELSANGYAGVRRHYTVQQMARRIIEVYSGNVRASVGA